MTTAVHSPQRLGRMALAFLRQDLIEDASYPMSLMLSQIGVVFPIFLFYFVGKLVPTSGLTGDYFSATVIGLSLAALLQASLSGFGGSLQRAQNRGTFETVLVEPVPWIFIPFAMNLWRISLGLIGAVLMLSLGALLGARFVATQLPLFAAVALLGVLATTAIGVVSASLMVLAKKSQPVLTLYGLAASLLGGAMFPIEVLPSWLRMLSYAVPHAYVISAGRQLLMAQPPDGGIDPYTALLVLAAFAIVVTLVGTSLFSRSLQYARKMGLLSGY